MSQRDSIHSAIDAVRQELAEVEGRAAKLRLALKSLLDLLPPPQLPLADVAEVKPLTQRLRNSSMAKAAAIVLNEAKEPLHINAIIERMAEGGYPVKNPKTLRLSLVGTLDRGAKPEEKGWFTKPMPATYGLREWQSHEMELMNGNGHK